MKPLEKIGNAGLVPVVIIENANNAVSAAKALSDAGLDVMEITMRTDAGIEAIKNVRAALPEMLVGAGTVLTIEKCKEAVDAGAQFIVSPGINPMIVNWCIKNDIPVTPGCVTPTEIETALGLGIQTVKYSPAEIYGGVKGCSALYSIYKSSGIKFMPTGGINNDNLADYADKPFIHAVGGGWLCKTSDISNQNFAAITENAKKAIEILLGFEIAHIGINQDTEVAASSLAFNIHKAFSFPITEGDSSIFLSSHIEITKAKYPGQYGHLAVRTNCIPRAIHYLKQRGLEVDLNTAKYNGDRMLAVYLKNEFAGFAVHLLQK